VLAQLAEFESVLAVTKVTGCIAQFEQHFTGAYPALVKLTAMHNLRKPTLMVANLGDIGKSPRLPRIEVATESAFSPEGKECLERAKLEGERRFCGNTSEVLTGAPIVLSDRDLKAALLDLRTRACSHLSEGDKAKAIKLYITSYIAFGRRATAYEQAKVVAEAARAAAEEPVEDEGKGKERDSKQRKLNAETGCEVGSTEAMVGLLGADTDEEDEVAEVDDEAAIVERLTLEAKAVLRRWLKLEIDWAMEFPLLQLVEVRSPGP
jgi:hypothetical protein